LRLICLLLTTLIVSCDSSTINNEVWEKPESETITCGHYETTETQPKTETSFPLKISNLKKLDISHKLEIDAYGQHNTATSMWLVNQPFNSTMANPSVIAAEVMIWTHATKKHFNPVGNKVSELAIDDVTWEVWYKKDWVDQSGANNNKWSIVTFRTKKPNHKIQFSALKLLQHAIELEFIPDNLYIADVELGNEVKYGSGLTWVKEFKVDYELNSL